MLSKMLIIFHRRFLLLIKNVINSTMDLQSASTRTPHVRRFASCRSAHPGHTSAARANRRFSVVGQRAAGIDLIRQHRQPADAAHLSERCRGIHALRQHYRSAGVSQRGTRARARLAPRPGAARSVRCHHPAQTRGPTCRCTQQRPVRSRFTWMEAAGHGADKAAPVFQPVSNNTRGTGRAITPGGVYQVLAKYAATAGIEVDGFGQYSLRATAATNALEHHADIAKVQEWLGHDHTCLRSSPPAR